MISEKLRNALLQFRRDRDWEQFHSPRNLATALSVEASELLENFQRRT
jgi:dCTP diphosphatase